MNRSTNKFRHVWIDEGKARGVELYAYDCRHCGAKRIKSSAFSFVYQRAGRSEWISRAPECKRPPTMKGVGKSSLDKLRGLAAAGGALAADEYFRRFGSKGNRLPFLIFKARVVESFVMFGFESEKGEKTRVGYRLTDAGRKLLEAEEGT